MDGGRGGTPTPATLIGRNQPGSLPSVPVCSPHWRWVSTDESIGEGWPGRKLRPFPASRLPPADRDHRLKGLAMRGKGEIGV